MTKILCRNFKYLTLIFATCSIFIGCNFETDNNTTVESNDASFSDSKKEKISCGEVPSNKIECSKKTLLSSEDMILETLMKNHPISNTVETKKEINSVSNALATLVGDIEPKSKLNTQKSLEFLVASASEFADSDEKSIGTFDIEKFSSTWQELQSLVDNSEETQIKQKNLRKNLEVLVVSASTDDENIEKVEKKVKALLDISTNAPSVAQTNFANTVMSDMSNKTIDLLEANSQWIKIKIRSGDTLSTYADKYYGDPNKYHIIYEANKDVIGENYVIHVGSTLIIPTLNSIKGI